MNFEVEYMNTDEQFRTVIVVNDDIQDAGTLIAALGAKVSEIADDFVRVRKFRPADKSRDWVRTVAPVAVKPPKIKRK